MITWLHIPLAVGRGLSREARCTVRWHSWQRRRRPFYRDGSPIPIWTLHYQACAWCGVWRRGSFRIKPFTPDPVTFQ